MVKSWSIFVALLENMNFNSVQGQISIHFQTVIMMKDFPSVSYMFTLIVATTYNHLINHLQNQVSELNFKSNKMIAKQLL